MGLAEAFPLVEVAERGALDRAFVELLGVRLRTHGLSSASEASMLIAFNRDVDDRDPDFATLFVEVLTEFVVRDTAPEGYVNAANARWLMSEIAPGGRIASRNGMELVVRIIETARWVPLSLVCAALDEVRRAVADGEGPLREGSGIAQGVVTADDVQLVRRVLCAYGRDGQMPVTRSEAEVLVAIDAAIVAGSAVAAWSDLFAKALLNAALSASGRVAPARSLALGSAPVCRDGGGPRPDGARAGHRRQTAEERALAALERQRVEIITNEAIPGDGVGWLAALAACPRGRRPWPAAIFTVLDG